MAVDPIYTLGHSTRDFDEVIQLLETNGIDILCDVRSYPGSRRFPHWNKEVLMHSMPDGIRYVHLGLLGGRRKPLRDSGNDGWRNASFRGFADYMQTSAFQSGIEALLDLYDEGNVAIMCSEAVPWRCHRSMISDAVIAEGVVVQDIISSRCVKEAAMTPFASVQRDGCISYPSLTGVNNGSAKR